MELSGQEDFKASKVHAGLGWPGGRATLDDE
jgi:hypothetical protein